ncbi:MAG: OFA family MFS transporter [Tissierellia bacterium]|nr:OFA family MFS transporter [Tissierellia bacterium]
MKENRGKVVLAAGTTINLMAGILYTWGIISVSLVNNLGWSYQEASLPYTIATLAFVIAMVPFGRVQDKVGPRITANIGLITMGVGMLLAGLYLKPALMPLWMAITGVGIGIVNVCAMPPAVKWFPPEKKGMVTGIVIAGVSVSSLWLAPVAQKFSDGVGINWYLIFIGIINLTISLGAAQLLVNPPESAKKERPSIAQLGVSWKEAVKRPSMWILWLMFGLSSSAGLMVIGHIGHIALQQANFTKAFLLVMLLALFNSLGRFIGGYLSDKMGRASLMRLIFIIQGTNMAAFRFYTNPVTIAIGVAIAGMCYGAGFAVFPATVADLYGLKDFGTNYGIMYTGWGVGGIIGPMAAATIADRFGNYNMAYILAFILLIISILFTFRLTWRMHRGE